jgi:hypothetical protein
LGKSICREVHAMIQNIVPMLFAAIAMLSSPQAASQVGSQAPPPAGPATSIPPSAPASVAAPAPSALGAEPLFRHDLVHADLFGDALELQQTDLARRNLHLVHGEIHGLGKEHLARFGNAVDACGDVHGFPEDVVIGERDFARIDGNAHIEPIVAELVGIVFAQQALHFDTGQHSIGGAVKHYEKGIADRLDQAPALAFEHG